MDNREGTVLQHGIFPEMRCAWELLDHSLLLWPCDGDGQPIWEYRSEKQPISALGLVKPRPDFVEDTAAHQYLLVLATPLELLLFGVSQDGEEDTLSHQVTVEKLVDYSTTSSDGVTMTCIASTDKGRIFLAGHNGLIYELLYTIGSPCRLVCCTPPPPMPVLLPDGNEWDERLSRDPASVVDLLKEMRNKSRFWVRDFDPVVEMVVDNERKILHARTKEAALKAYFLGMKGESPIEKLGQVDNLLDHHSPDKAAAGASRTNKLSIVSISPLSSKLESNAHLVVVLSDCTRIYLSTSSSSQSSPNCLRVVTTPNLTDQG